MNENAETLEEIRREIIGLRFTGRVILDCDRGRIEKIEVVTRRVPPWKRRESERLAAGKAPELTPSPTSPKYA